jgi:hypothetical protein
VRQLAEFVGVAASLVPVLPELTLSIARDEQELAGYAAEIGGQNEGEPYRRKLSFVWHRLGETLAGGPEGYGSSADFLDDLDLIDSSLRANRGQRIADGRRRSPHASRSSVHLACRRPTAREPPADRTSACTRRLPPLRRRERARTRGDCRIVWHGKRRRCPRRSWNRPRPLRRPLFETTADPEARRASSGAARRPTRRAGREARGDGRLLDSGKDGALGPVGDLPGAGTPPRWRRSAESS